MKIHVAYSIFERVNQDGTSYEAQVTLNSGVVVTGPAGALRSDLGLLPIYVEEENKATGEIVQLVHPIWIDVAEIAAIRIIDLG